MRAAAEAVVVCASVRGRWVVEGAEADAEPEAAVPLVSVFRASIASDAAVEEAAGRLEAGSREAGRVQPVSASKKTPPARPDESGFSCRFPLGCKNLSFLFYTLRLRLSSHFLFWAFVVC